MKKKMKFQLRKAMEQTQWQQVLQMQTVMKLNKNS